MTFEQAYAKIHDKKNKNSTEFGGKVPVGSKLDNPRFLYELEEYARMECMLQDHLFKPFVKKGGHKSFDNDISPAKKKAMD